MKKQLLPLVYILVILCSAYQSEAQGNQPVSPTVINSLDSVYFDLEHATIVGNQVEFPVFFRSDDQIFSLDFEFKYDHALFEFDTVMNLTSYMYALTYYNPNDSVVRLTSYSFSLPYTNDTALVIVRMNVLSGQLCSASLNSVGALLNGDVCSYRIVECLFIGMEENPFAEGVKVYPNPATDHITVDSPVAAGIEIYDVLSGQVYFRTATDGTEPADVDISELRAGVYFVRLENGEHSVVRKITVQ